MSVADQISEQARFAARAFVAQWFRETGERPFALLEDRMLFAYEMGYLRGQREAKEAMIRMMDGDGTVAVKDNNLQPGRALEILAEQKETKTDDDSE